ncbi:HXXEE domain-containing protein [Clostridium sp. E02]|uniref:HXXEE domain-containing protein n=1 Tax=Clostridium sp. E02 TaxID=2487134 RepID=UPI000F54C022|nr:HXXEE domain-containing protein [Clostridium sp. E02]
MNTMNFIVWLFPVIFMIHDFEEIIMTEVWGKRFKKEIDTVWPKRQPFGLDYIHVYQTPTFTIGVVIEFLLFSFISFFSVYFQSYFLWYSAFFGITIHLVLAHMLLCVKFKHYVPGIITSIVFILPSIWILYLAKTILQYNMGTILLTAAAGILIMIIIIPVLHKAMESWSKSLKKYSEAK